MAEITAEYEPPHPWDRRLRNSTTNSSESGDSSRRTNSPVPPTQRPDGYAEGDVLEKQPIDQQRRDEQFDTRISRVQSLTSRKANDGTFSHPLAHVKTAASNLVEFEGDDDPYRPINWPFRKKCITTALYALTTMGATLASTLYSPEVATISQEYGVGEEVAILGISFTLAGSWLSEIKRKKC